MEKPITTTTAPRRKRTALSRLRNRFSIWKGTPVGKSEKGKYQYSESAGAANGGSNRRPAAPNHGRVVDCDSDPRGSAFIRGLFLWAKNMGHGWTRMHTGRK